MDLTAIAGYQVIRQLGAGGMGQVFLVQHPRLPRRDALKLLDAGVSRNDDFKARFQREADLLAQLSHPNIITLYDRGEYDERLWITMEFVDGTDAGDLLQRHGPLPVHLVVALIGGSGAALDYAWRKQRITHRDVKPANILVALAGDEIEAVKLADFGIAKAAGESMSLTATGFAVGTMNYISPEAIEGLDVDHRSDVYSLGCTAYHLLSGEPPYTAPTMTSLMAAHLNRPIPAITDVAPDLPEALNGVFARVLAKDPDERFATCGEFVSAFAEAVGGESSSPAHARTLPARTLPAASVPQRKAPDTDSGETRSGTKPSWPTAVLIGAAAVIAMAVVALGVFLVRDDQGSGTPHAAAPAVSTTTVTRSVAPSSTASPSSPSYVATPPMETATTTYETLVPAPVEGQPCDPYTDTRSPDGRLSCSGMDSVWRDMSYQTNPPVAWNSPCSEPGARTRVQNTDAIVTCKPTPSGGYMWQQ
ncbi:serine/threonine-protein kinase [Gordonia caeni]|uniref:non-specific serine/threonine protein kinase n=1 Tax=Gordonia caeni TaxID=1007097 RepID=A0ABP7PP48_9ACTN